jgi:DNA-binding NtrC family response regulator
MMRSDEKGVIDVLPGLLGQAPTVLAIREKVARLLDRQSDARRLPPILIQGETGTGKGLLARLIHRSGPRADGPFVELNCAALPDTLLESELFGFERGAFTDARQAKPGLFQAAGRGTIFLDEIGLMPEACQAKLLKVIEERVVRRLGSTRTEPVDAWVIAASNEDLEAAARQRRFREDLFHRLDVLTLRLPPLRERPEDIQLLAGHFLTRACAEYGLPPRTLTADAEVALRGYRWPGNVRELSNVIERVALLSETGTVTAEMLALGGGGTPAAGTAAAPEAPPAPRRLDDVVDDAERAQLLAALTATDWNVTRTAARLAISRNTLRYRMEKHGLSREAGGSLARPPRMRARPSATPPPAPVTGTLRPPVPVPSAPKIRWERRRLTLVRAAIGAAAAEASWPGAGGLLESLVEKVQSFGGRVEELGRGGVAAAFGLDPVEDGPRRAAHAAMAMLKAVERARREGDDVPPIHIALHVGQLLVGQGGSAATIDQDGKRAAEGVLESLLRREAADAILVSAAAAPFLDRRFELVQETDGPDRVWRLAGWERTGLGLGRRMARFVGRRHDLEMLDTRLASAVEGHGQLVGIVGEAGIGKSRLLYEFRQSLAGRSFTYVEGHCLSYGSAIPFVPVLGVLRQNFGLVEGEGGPAAAAKVRDLLIQLGMSPEEWAPPFHQLLGVREGIESLADLSPEAARGRTLDAVRQMCLRASEQRPLVIAVEDLHWVDRTSEEFISALVDTLRGARILFISTYRPGYRPPWLDRSFATQMALQPLPPRDGLAIVQSVLQPDAVPEGLAQLIVARGEGNPFFLEELSRAVIEGGELRAREEVPETVQDVIQARIERLPEETRRLLQTAAVLGREVSPPLLRAMGDETRPIEPGLRELTDLEFLFERTRLEGPVYVFTHAFTHEVAYQTVPVDLRPGLHAAAGRALEGLYAGQLEEISDRLAYHYSRTGEHARAVDYLTLSAARAARGQAHAEAVRALAEAMTHAAELADDERDRRRIELALRQAASLILLGRFRESAELLGRERALVAAQQDAGLAARYHFLLARTANLLGDRDAAASEARRCIAEAERAGDRATMGRGYYLLAEEAPFTGRAREGIEHGRRAVTLLEHAGERWWLGQAHWVVALNFLQTGRLTEARDAVERAGAIGEAIGDPKLRGLAAWVEGVTVALLGDTEGGVRACEHSLALAQDPLNTALAMGWLGFVLLERGETQRAIAMLEDSVERMRRLRYRRFQAWFTAFLAEAHRVRGDVHRARTVASEAIQVAGEAGLLVGAGWARLVLGRLALGSGALDEAERHLGEAFRAFDQVGSRYEQGRAAVDLATVARARGDREGAARHLGGAAAIFEELALPGYVDHVRRLVAELGARTGGSEPDRAS